MPYNVRGMFLNAAATTLAVVIALLLALAMWPWIGASNIPLFLPAVLLGAWLGGMPLALLATALSAFAIRFAFIEPYGSLVVTPEIAFRVLLFLLAATVVSVLAVFFRRSEAAQACQ